MIPFEFMVREFRYHFTANWQLDYTKHLRLRAGRDGLHSFVDKIFWTGGDTGLPECVSDFACTVRPMLDAPGIWDHYQVDFGEPLRPGQEVEFELRWPGLTNWPHARPFVSTSTHEPTRELRFDLRIPLDLRLDDHATIEMHQSADTLEPLSAEPLRFDEAGQLFHRIEEPPAGRHFRVNWRWSPNIVGSRLLLRGEPALLRAR